VIVEGGPAGCRPCRARTGVTPATAAPATAPSVLIMLRRESEGDRGDMVRRIFSHSTAC
jgi:hypothetical protein